MADIIDDIVPIPPGPWVCPRQRGAEPCDCPDCNRTVVHMGLYPSGAKFTITEGDGFTIYHWELPYHSEDLYEILAGYGDKT